MRITQEQYDAMMAKRTTKKAPRVKGAKKKVVNGMTFDSTREARRYQDLELMQRSGQISDLRRQVPFAITVNGVFICEYYCDFTYAQPRIGKPAEQVYEDSKGFATEIYRLKRKLVEAIYGIKIKET